MLDWLVYFRRNHCEAESVGIHASIVNCGKHLKVKVSKVYVTRTWLWAIICYDSRPLGQCKNIGKRLTEAWHLGRGWSTQ